MRMQLVGDEHFDLTMAIHGFPVQFQCCFTVSPLKHIAFFDLTLMIHRASKVVLLSVDLH